MPTYIALYRGINVGGNNSVRMESLRALHERLGHRGVRNYIQSGNIVFTATGSGDGLAKKLAVAFEKEFGFAARVLIVEASAWQDLVKNNPYRTAAEKEPKTVHAAICEGPPSETALKALLAKTGGKEQFTIRDRILYLHAPDGFGTSKFAVGMEKACGVPITARNWRTILAIDALLNDH